MLHIHNLELWSNGVKVLIKNLALVTEAVSNYTNLQET